MQTVVEAAISRQQLDRAVSSMEAPDPGLMRTDPIHAVWDAVMTNERQRDEIIEAALHLAALQVLQAQPQQAVGLQGSWELIYSSNRWVVALASVLTLSQDVRVESSACGQHVTTSTRWTAQAAGASGRGIAGLRLRIPPWLSAVVLAKRTKNNQVLYLDPAAHPCRVRVDWDGAGDIVIFRLVGGKAEADRPALRSTSCLQVSKAASHSSPGVRLPGILTDRLFEQTLMQLAVVVVLSTCMLSQKANAMEEVGYAVQAVAAAQGEAGVDAVEASMSEAASILEQTAPLISKVRGPHPASRHALLSAPPRVL